MRLTWWFSLVLGLIVLPAGCVTVTRVPPTALRLEGLSRDLQVGDIVDTHSRAVISFEDLIAALADQQVVYVGETHTSVNDHRLQEQILEALHQRNRHLVVAMEMFPRPVQTWLDQWTEGRLDEEQFLNGVDWEHNWGYPVAFYRPILDYCRANHIRMVALNAPPKIVKEIGQRGLDQLVPSDRAQVAADFDFTDGKHREAIHEQYEQHLAMFAGAGGFEHFYEAQLAWEETMAETLAARLSGHPAAAQIVAFMGNGHIAYRFGVPARTFRRFPHSFRTVVPLPWNSTERTIEPDLADYVVITAPEAPFHGHRGRLGVRLEPLPEGKGLRIVAVMPDSPAARADLKPGDVLLRIDDAQVITIEDVHKALMASEAGKEDRHRIVVQRDGAEVEVVVSIPAPP